MKILIDDIKGIKESYDLINFINIDVSNFKKYNSYIEEGFYYDHILEYENYFINFCKITKNNKHRYLVLEQINSKLNSKYFIPSDIKIFSYKNSEWFYEKIPKYNSITINSKMLPMLWQNLESLNYEVSLIDIDKELINSNNNFFKKISYYEITKLIFPEKFLEHDYNLNSSNKLYMPFSDLEKTIELNRIIFNGNNFVFTGLQSFLPCPFEFATHFSMLYSSIDDDDSELIEKLKLLNYPHALIKIINSIREQIFRYPSFYLMDCQKLLKHLNRVEYKWKELQ